MGCQKFDDMYRSVYKLLSSMHIGQYLVVSKVCRNPENRGLFLMMCEIYHNMDFFVNLSYDEAADTITVMPTADGRISGPYSPPDVYSKIIKNPELWGVSLDDI